MNFVLNKRELRQELKGMAVSGIVRPRSKSSSPTKTCTRSLSGNATPKRQREPSPVPKPSVQPTVEVIPTSRTVSECSNASRDVRPQDRHKVTVKPSAGYVIDTRSKTLNNATPIPKSGEVVDIVTNRTRKKPSVTPAPPSRPNSGYGKPLVTPVNKKLIIRRESPPQRQIVGHVTTEKSPPVLRSKSPMKTLKGEKKETALPSNSSKKNDISKAKQPTKALTSGNRLRASHDTNVNVEVKLMKSNIASKNTKSSSSHNKNLKTTKHELPVNARSWNQDPVRKVSAPLHEVTGKSKNLPTNASFGRPNSAAHSNKSFKPQLEDIKSSYLLLNKKNRDKVKSSENEKPDLPRVSKPEPFSENHRKEQLLETRKKFKSKQFWNDAKYDKIEGLNWISWN